MHKSVSKLLIEIFAKSVTGIGYISILLSSSILIPFGFTVTMISSVLEQPFESVTSNMKVVDCPSIAVGFEMYGESR